MPRTRKTIGGDTAQKIESVPGQRYGEGKEQAELQTALPAPQVDEVAGNMSQTIQAPAQRPKPSSEDMAAFLQTNNPRLLSGTQRPDEPITAGLSIGRGAGDTDVGLSTTPIARTLRTLSDQTGNPKWRRLAERAGL